MIILALIFAVFFMLLGASQDSILLFIFGLIFIFAIPGIMKFMKRTFRFAMFLTIVLLVGVGISSLSFPLFGIIASGYIIINSCPEDWGFSPYRISSSLP